MSLSSRRAPVLCKREKRTPHAAIIAHDTTQSQRDKHTFLNPCSLVKNAQNQGTDTASDSNAILPFQFHLVF